MSKCCLVEFADIFVIEVIMLVDMAEQLQGFCGHSNLLVKEHGLLEQNFENRRDKLSNPMELLRYMQYPLAMPNKRRRLKQDIEMPQEFSGAIRCNDLFEM